MASLANPGNAASAARPGNGAWTAQRARLVAPASAGRQESRPIPGRACGAWDAAASYRAITSVAHNGSEWRAVKDDPGPLPGDGWRLGAKGSRGKPGEPGKPGKPGARVAELVLADDALVLVHDDGSALSVDLKPLRERAS